MSCRYPAISLVIQTGDEDEIELESSALLQVAREADILSVLKNVEKTRDSVSIDLHWRQSLSRPAIHGEGNILVIWENNVGSILGATQPARQRSQTQSPGSAWHSLSS